MPRRLLILKTWTFFFRPFTRASPDSTRPGPISITTEACACLSVSMHSRQNTGAVSCQDFLANASHRQYPPAQRDLTGHPYIVEDFPTGESRDQRGRHGDPCAGAIFWYGTFGDMDMDIDLLVDLGVHLELS